MRVNLHNAKCQSERNRFLKWFSFIAKGFFSRFSCAIHFLSVGKKEKRYDDRHCSMGNKNTSPHLINSLSINGYDNHRSFQQHNLTNNDDTDNSCETSSYQSSNGKKHGPSPRFRRRRDTRQSPADKKGKRLQVIPINNINQLNLICVFICIIERHRHFFMIKLTFIS